jgi:hypothetical protein
MIKANIIDLQSDISARVTGRGELVVGSLAFSSASNATATVSNVGYNLVTPRAENCFVITSILIYANGVSANGATIDLYTADSPNSTTVQDTLLTTICTDKQARDFIGFNLLVRAGSWVNVKVSDNSVYFTLMGYYIENCELDHLA